MSPLQGVLCRRCKACHVAFVGSRKKAAALKLEFAKDGVCADAFAALHAPAGLDLVAITPDEIALSIVVEMVQRHGQRRGTLTVYARPSLDAAAPSLQLRGGVYFVH
jgi:xanthine/CO dehydrogenase XdhC/CoxF family maturation factor